MPILKTSDLVKSISQLGTKNIYSYPSGNTKFRIVEVNEPEGPIKFLRWKSDKLNEQGSSGTISTNQLSTVASVFSTKPNYPIHFDRLFSAGGNTRSALEALLANTPNFFICYLQRTHVYTGARTVQKHIMWYPDKTHPLGEIGETTYDQEISEVEFGLDFGTIRLPESLSKEFSGLEVEAKKTHTQMQVALVRIGNALNFKTWIARNDRSIVVGNTQLGKLEGVIQSLNEVTMLHTPKIKEAASLIDCIWFTAKNDFIPALIEVEHSTGVTSGLTRMLKFRELMPSFTTNFTIVAPNELRNKVVKEANDLAFRELNARYMPYSAVRELYGLIQRYPLSGVVDRKFIEPFMEKVVD